MGASPLGSSKTLARKRWSAVFAVVLFVAVSLYCHWSMARTFAIPSIDGPYYYI